MLVLTRKANEQIVIGDDIKITVVRLRGNTVRIGIEAPRDIRVVRGELETNDSNAGKESFPLSDREQAFAHPQPKPAATKPARMQLPLNPALEDVGGADSAPKIFVGRVQRSGQGAELCRAPLARFISAT